jgi:hypothetical protein
MNISYKSCIYSEASYLSSFEMEWLFILFSIFICGIQSFHLDVVYHSNNALCKCQIEDDPVLRGCGITFCCTSIFLTTVSPV